MLDVLNKIADSFFKDSDLMEVAVNIGVIADLVNYHEVNNGRVGVYISPSKIEPSKTSNMSGCRGLSVLFFRVIACCRCSSNSDGAYLNSDSGSVFIDGGLRSGASLFEMIVKNIEKSSRKIGARIHFDGMEEPLCHNGFIYLPINFLTEIKI